MDMFWAVKLEKGKRFSQNVEASYHLTMAALDLSEGNKDKSVTVFVEKENKQTVICSLNKSVPQQPLDLVFGEAEDVTYFVKGEGNVHLSGYLLPPEDEMDGDLFDEDMSDEEEDVKTQEIAIGNGMGDMSKKAKAIESMQLKRKNDVQQNKVSENKKMKVEQNKKQGKEANKPAIKKVVEVSDNDSDEDDEEDESEDDDSEDLADLMGTKDLDGDDDEEEDDSDDDDEEDVKIKSFQDKMKKQLEETKNKQKNATPQGKQQMGNKNSPQKKAPFQGGFQQKSPQQGGGFQQKKDFTPKQNNQQKGGTPYSKNVSGGKKGSGGKFKQYGNKPKPWNSNKK